MPPYVSLSELKRAAVRGEFDFVLTNPSSYVEMEVAASASPVLTMLNEGSTGAHDRFGAVIFSLKGNTSIRDNADFRDKRLIAVSEKAFGGWQIAYKELLEQNINPYTHFASVDFADGIQANVIDAVVSGTANIGIVRTSILERMAANGKLQLEDVRIHFQKHTPGFSFLQSTRLYPEWAFAKFPSTPDDVAKQVAIALLQMPHQHPAAQLGKYNSWTVPKDYSAVHELLKTLKLPPTNILEKSVPPRPSKPIGTGC